MHLSVRRELLAELREQREKSRLAQDDAFTSGIKRIVAGLTKKWVEFFNGIAGEIADRYISSGMRYTDSAMMGALKDAGFAVKFKLGPAAREGYAAVIQENIGLIKSIPERYLSRVQGDVWRCVTQGYDLEALTKSLQKNYGSTRKRAELIARDQTNKAKAVIEQVRRQELGVTKAIWQHSGAGKHPRPSHMAANGKEFEIAKGMYLDGEWVLPGTAINCRCTSKAILPFGT